jgi:hypothetical protein
MQNDQLVSIRKTVDNVDEAIAFGERHRRLLPNVQHIGFYGPSKVPISRVRHRQDRALDPGRLGGRQVRRRTAQISSRACRMARRRSEACQW